MRGLLKKRIVIARLEDLDIFENLEILCDERQHEHFSKPLRLFDLSPSQIKYFMIFAKPGSCILTQSL